ncbi:cation transporter [Candidatus Woesearchaeota archaeon]|nr:cation transporter [Candidatus Woesearchaeota archaeon]
MTKREDNFKIAVLLNVTFTIIEIIGGLWTNSLAILSDALHDFGDSVALISGWFLDKKSRQKKPDTKRTYGYQRLSLLSALFSGIVLVGGSLFILAKAIPRLLNPEHVNSTGMIGIAIVGILFNGLGFWRMHKGKNLNSKVLSWHLLEDVLGWIVILIGGIIMTFWDTHIIDPIMTIGITVFVLYGVTKNVREAFNIFLQGVPKGMNVEDVKKSLIKIRGVKDVHDVHIWSLEGETNIFTGHIVVSDKLLRESDETRKKIKKVMKENNLQHSTIELESPCFCSGIECEKTE